MEDRAPQNALLFSSVECALRTADMEGFPVLPHWHYYGEIVRVRSGSLKILRGEKEYILSDGDAAFFTPLMLHAIDYGVPGAPVTYEVIRLDMELFRDFSSYSPDLRGMVLEAERRGFPMIVKGAELQVNHTDIMIDNCISEYRNRAYGYDLRIRAMLYLIFTSLIRRWIAAGFVPQNYPSSIDPIYTLPNYIARHIDEPLKVEELAEYCGLSYPWFARKFRQIYGITCKEYIEKIRIRRVEHYLLFTDCDLLYITRHTGYADCSHLVRDFRKLRNTTPGQFRQTARKNYQEPPQFPQNY